MSSPRVYWRGRIHPLRRIGRSTVSPEVRAVVFTAAYRAASLDLRLTRVAILQNSPTHFHTRYLSTLLGLKSEF